MSRRVLLVEDDAGTRAALAAGLSAMGMTVVGEFARGEDAVAGLDAADPDVALVDMNLPGIQGPETIRRLRAKRPTLPVLVLTVLEEPTRIVEAIESGACGYLLKGAPLARIVDALAQVHQGLSPLSPEVARHVLARFRSDRAPGPAAPAITAREREILSLLVGGHTYAAVALALGIGIGTVQTHIKNLYRKLEVCTKAEATAVAVRTGLVGPD